MKLIVINAEILRTNYAGIVSEHVSCLEAVQERIRLGASRTVAGAAVRDDLGWRKLEEKREEKKLLYGKKLGNLEESRLVKTEKLKNSGGVGCMVGGV